jgi:hypothetical protein
MQVLAQSTGQNLIRVSEDIATHTAQQWAEQSNIHPPNLFAAEKRRLDRENPGYAE